MSNAALERRLQRLESAHPGSEAVIVIREGDAKPDLLRGQLLVVIRRCCERSQS